MRRHLILLTAVLAMSAPAAAAERPAFLPAVPGAAEGVVVSASGRTVTVRFTGASAAVGRTIAGQTVNVNCRVLTPSGLLFAARPRSERVADQWVRAAADGTVTAKLKRTGDGCEIYTDSAYAAVARVGLTPAGQAWADEINVATALFDATYLGRPGATYAPAEALVARGGGRIVALPGPDATPPPGQVGYWTDGGRHAVFSTVSAAGRRLFWEDLDGRAHRGNVSEAYYDYVSPSLSAYAQVLALDDRERGVKPYAIDSPWMAEHGVRASPADGRVTLRFTGPAKRAFARIAGHRVTATCSGVPSSTMLGAPPTSDTWNVGRVIRVPRRGGVVRLPALGVHDECELIDDGTSIAIVWPTAAGHRYVQQSLDDQAFYYGSPLPLARPGTTAYPGAATLVAAQPKAVTLAGPDATPRRGVVGVWTDGARQAALVRVVPDGRRMFALDEGDGILRTNIADPELMAAIAGVA